MNRFSIAMLLAASLLLGSCASPELGLCEKTGERLTLPVLM